MNKANLITHSPFNPERSPVRPIFFVFFLFLLFFCQKSFGQDNRQGDFGKLLEDYFAEDETHDLEQLLNELQQLSEHPLNINAVGEADLEKLPFLNPVLIRSLISYRGKYGGIRSPYELAAVAGFDEKLARLTACFVTFDNERSEPGKGYSRHEVMTRWARLMERQAAFTEPRKYEGSPDRLYFRYRYESPSLEASFTGDKDAGESFFSRSNPRGFDFCSAFVRLRSGDQKKTFVLGDYIVRFGQGLAVSQGFSLSKSGESTRIGNFNSGIRGYSSADENNFMRGMAATLTSGRFSISPFVSGNRLDANLTGQQGEKIFTSFQTSGYHRTAGEISDENSVAAFTLGGNITYDAVRLSLGLTAIHTRYEYPLIREEDPYNRYLFNGKRAGSVSLDYRYGINRVYFFGEIAASETKGLAATSGLMCQPLDKLELSLLFRRIGRRYSSPYASSFSESSQANDENGCYLGARLNPLPRVSINTYLDVFRFNRIKYTTASAGSGYEFLFRTDYSLSENWQAEGRYFYERKPVKVTGEFSKTNIDQIRQSLRISIRGEPGRTITLKSRFEQTFYRHDHYSCGFFICQDFGYHPENVPLTFWARMAYFRTGDYDSRIYAYENDLLYQFSVPSFYGEGIRSYLTGKVKICEKVEFWYKLSRTWFLGVDRIGSGNSLILGNKRTEVKFQIRFRI